MDFSDPLSSVLPGVTGRVLAVLLNTSLPLTGRTIASLAGTSTAQTARVLPHLVDLGIVEARPSPPSTLYSVVDEHVAVGPLRELASAHDRFIGALAERVAARDPRPVCVAAFGSFARRQAREGSDIDLLVVRPAGIATDDAAWEAVVEAIRSDARRLSGNSVDILEVSESDASGLLASSKPLWDDIRRDALAVHGPHPADL